MPIPPEEEIQHWVEELFGIKLDCSLFMAIEDGALLLEITNVINPSFKISVHRTRNEATVKDHFQKFAQVADLLGVPKDLLFKHEQLNTDEGKKVALRCLAVLKDVSIRLVNRPGRSKSRTDPVRRVRDPYERIRQLEQELADLQEAYDEVLEENERLQDAVVKLDEINRKMVIDLMKELSSRSQEMTRRRSNFDAVSAVKNHRRFSDNDDEDIFKEGAATGRAPSPATRDLLPVSKTPASTEYFKTNAANLKAQESKDCSIQ